VWLSAGELTQPVAWVRAKIVAPSDRRSKEITKASLLPSRGAALLASAA
jgi:hypothetical protein